MIKKRKLKLYHKIGHIFLLSVMIFGSVFGYFQATKTAQAEGCILEVQNGRPFSIKFNGTVYTGATAQFLTNKDSIKMSEPFDAYTNISLPEDPANACAQLPVNSYYFTIYVYEHDGSGYINSTQLTQNAVFTGSGFSASFKNIKLSDLGITAIFDRTTQLDFLAFFYRQGASQSITGRDYLDKKVMNFAKPDDGAYGQPVRTLPEVGSTSASELHNGAVFEGKDLSVDYTLDENYFRAWRDGGRLKLYKANDPNNYKGEWSQVTGPVVSADFTTTKPYDVVSFYDDNTVDDRGIDLQFKVVYAQLFTDKATCTQASQTVATWVTTCKDPGHNVVYDKGSTLVPDPPFPYGLNQYGQSKQYWKKGNPAHFKTNLVEAAEEYGLNKVGTRNKAYVGVGFAKGGQIIPASDVWIVKKETSLPAPVYVEIYKDEADFNAHLHDDRPSDIEANTGVSGSASDVTACQSNALICFMRDVIVFVVSLIREIIYTIFFYIILPILQAVLSIRTYTETFSSVIYPGWVIIRNVCNVFLILAMLIIGLATLFRIDGYNYKQLLVKVILAALFVNFSLVLAQAILGIADTVQNQFLPNATEPLNQLGSALMVGNVAGSFPSLNNANPSGFADIVFSIFQLGLSIGSFIAFAAIAALLVVRLVALWILLMISPVAWVADVLPATSKYRGEWWSNFLKYAFFSPIMGFFLNLTAIISLTLHEKLRLITGENFLNSANGTGELSSFIFQVATNVLLVAFLVAAVMVAQSFGIKGADVAVSAVTKGLKSPFGAFAYGGKLGLKGAGLGANYLAEKAYEKTGVEIRPAKWAEGWKESREINKKRREDAGLMKAQGRHTFGNPVAAFQRYWGLSTLTGKIFRDQKQGQGMLDEAAELDEQAEGLEHQIEQLEAQGAPHATIDALKAQRQGLLERARSLEYEGKQLVMPQDFYTQEKARHSIHEQKAKIHAETWEELVDLAIGAEKEGQTNRYMAIFQKLAETYNENELITHTKYGKDVSAAESADGVAHKADDTFDQSAQGVENFRRFVIRDKMGLSEDASMRYMADISDIAEQHRHWGIARVYGTKYGKMFYKPEAERDAEARAEKAKIDEGTKNGSFNRLGDFDELVDTNYLATGTRFDLMQDNGVRDLIQAYQNIRFRLGRGTFNNSKMKATSHKANVAKIRYEIDRLPDELVEKKTAQGITVKDAAGNPVEVDIKDQLHDMMDELEQAAKEAWKPGEQKEHQEAIIRRADGFQDAGGAWQTQLPKHHLDALINAGYLQGGPGNYSVNPAYRVT